MADKCTPQADFDDLVALALVSSHFNALATPRLYRRCIHSFEDAELSNLRERREEPLAKQLDTMALSPRQPAQYLKSIRFDAPRGKMGEREATTYSYERSCGKFLSTLLLLAIRQAKGLATFQYVIPIMVIINSTCTKQRSAVTYR